MDSHLFDYNDFSCDERNNFIKKLDKRMYGLNGKIYKVAGKTYLLWHPQTLTKDYGWETSFRSLIQES